MMKKYLLYSALFLALTACEKMDNSPKIYSGRICENISDAMNISSCKNKCSPVEVKTSFEVDTKLNKVITITWKDRKKIDVSELEGCKVVDKENWTCKEIQGSETMLQGGSAITASNLGQILSVVDAPILQMAMCYIPDAEK